MNTLPKEIQKKSTAPYTPEMLALEALDATNHKKETSYWFILNPAANNGKAKKQLKWLEAALNRRREETFIQITHKKGDAIEFSEKAKSKSDIIVACGGDGTINEVAQSLVGSSNAIAVLPMGSGNDFFKNISRHKQLDDAFSLLFAPFIRKIDVGEATFEQGGKRVTRYFFNSLGLGFTGEIASEAARSNFKGDLIYLDAIRKVGAAYSSTPMKINLTNNSETDTFEKNVFAITIGNGRIEGGKFIIAPQAKIDDGFLDVSILFDFPKWQLPLWISRFMRGTHIEHPNLTYRKVNTLTISFQKPMRLHLDGEVFEGVMNDLKVTCLPSALNVVTTSN